MKATDLLEKQHREVERLFDEIKASSDKKKKEALFVDLASRLVAHDAIERELFYPACEKKMGMNDVLGEALVEHGVVEFSLYEAAQSTKKDDFDFKLTVLEEMIEHHVEDEETELLPKARKALGPAALEELGAAMEERFEEAKAADFRDALLDNLRQVLAGAIKPVKNGSPPEKKKPAARSKHA